ncbi:MAG TPA: ABC transporter permease [Bryobacteraceae bacterium]|nr:ABC transporter permease [Bryobacteraceae bacterium]
MNSLLQDLSYGFRMLSKSPGSTLIAVAALALGIGANTAIFSVVNAVLLRPLPYQDPEHLVVVWITKLDKGILQEYVSPPDYRDWVQRNRVFDKISALKTQPSVLTGGQLPERVETALVSAGAFELLGAKASLGRTFFANEDQAGQNRVAVLSHGLWQRRFGSDPGVLGKTVIVDGNSFNIVGVMPADFHLLDTPSELWMPYTLDNKEENENQRGFRTLRVIAHLKPGVSLDQAQAEMRSIEEALARQYPDVDVGCSTKIVVLREQLVGDIRTTLWTLLAAVAFVLLIACANVANLLLARAANREKEIALRAALGANPGRLVRQLLTESVLLALGGGLLGLALAEGSVTLLKRLGPATLPRLAEISIDWRVLVFTLLVSVLTGIVFGLAPALGSVRSDLNSILKTSGRGNTGSRARAQLRNTLVVAEIASCVVLLAGAGLLIRSFVRLQSVSPGFRPDHVLTMQITLPETRYAGWKVASFYRQLVERMQALPGVQSAGIARNLPLSGVDVSLNFTVENRPVEASMNQPRAKYRTASPDYFTALGIPLIRGRYFDRTDGEKTAGVALINNTLARRLWPNEDPLGKRIKPGFDDSVWCTIVGIVGDVKHTGLDAAVNPETYYHYLQVPPALMGFVEGTMTLVLRTNAEPAAMTAAARTEVEKLDPGLAIYNVKTMDDLVSGSLAQPRFRTLLLGMFAGVAMILAAIGLYGVIAYTVTQRTNEMGVRMALGAQKGDVLKLVVGQGARLAAVGVAIGLVAALGLMRVISKLLFAVDATDPITFAGTAGLIVAVSLAASYVPALRAAKVDPVVALRAE